MLTTHCKVVSVPVQRQLFIQGIRGKSGGALFYKPKASDDNLLQKDKFLSHFNLKCLHKLPQLVLACHRISIFRAPY